ncbi:MAG: hypothetical protein ACI4IW_00395 [Oscillospiraceae bacterium]
MKTNSLFKRLVSMLIVVLMICTLFPVTALAQPGDPWKPAEPTYNDLKSLLEVEIDCETKGENHKDKHPERIIGLLDNSEGTNDSFSVTKVNDHTYTVTVYSQRYIQAYSNIQENGKEFGPHSPEKNKDISKTVTLKYNNRDHKWQLDDKLDDENKNHIPEIEFDVVCNGTPTPEPAVTGITKTVMTSAPTDLTNVPTGITYPDADNIATVPYGTTSVTLLYKVTVRGDVGASYSVTDEGATCISNNASGTIPQGGEAVLYFTKTFTDLRTGDNTCSNTAAVKDTNFSATANVTVKVSIPEKPNDDKVKELLANGAVKIDCTNTYAVGHDDRTYGLIAGSYTVSGVSGDATNGYTCTVTVNSAKYIEQYNTDIGTTHSLADGESASKNITLEYKDNAWGVKTGSAPVTFTVDCNTPAPAVKGITKEVMTSAPTDLTNVPTGITYPDADNIATVPYGTTSVTLLYKVTVRGDVGASYSVTDEGATCISNNASGTIPQGGEAVLYFTKTFTDLRTGDNTCSNTAAVKDTNFSATANVTVKVSIPEKPTDDEVKKLLANGAVTIQCKNGDVDHADATYGLLPNSENKNDSYSIGTVAEKDGVYTCVITVYPTLYVDTYDEQTGVTHKLDPDTQVSAPITLKYVDKEWTVDAPVVALSEDAITGLVTFTVMCETPATTYTVTYKDGVGGKVFKDDVHTVESGTTTPAFVGGIPTRPGYVFVGWTPTVSKTVTGDATYTATWRKVKDTTVIEIGGGNSSSSGEENPNTGAPVFVGVAIGALAAAK